MMQSQNCKCPHHWFTMILRLAELVSGVLFFWTALRGVDVWGLPSGAWFEFFIILALAVLSMRGVCNCCCGDKHCDSCPFK
jgi:hypothetical protein